MKYFAILKESLREALDSKVLYVLFALSTIAILFVASLSFKPLSAEQTMSQFFWGNGFPTIILALDSHKPQYMSGQAMSRHMMQHSERFAQFHLDKVELIRGNADAPESDYALTITRRSVPPLAGKEQPNPAKGLEDVRGIFQDAEDLGLLKIGEVQVLLSEQPQPNTTHYKVILHGTRLTHHIWAAEPSFLFGMFPLDLMPVPVGYQLYVLSSIVLGFGSWAAVLLGVIITSLFIPNMLHKGTIDMLLVKPIHRWTLLLYKYVGGLTFIFLSTAYAMIGMWFVIGIRTSIWAHSALLMIFTLTFFFAILYAISTFVAVMTRSTITAILTTIGAWFLFFVIGAANQHFETRSAEIKGKTNQPFGGGGRDPAARKKIEEQSEEEKFFANATAGVYSITPRTSDLSNLNDLFVYCGLVIGSLQNIGEFQTDNFVWWQSLLVSCTWIAVFLGISCFWFSYKDY
jgi:ABC-type transport system involved in multi-copper enzyme maturation permease subunit